MQSTVQLPVKENTGISVPLATAEQQETAAYRRGMQIGITYGLLFSILVTALCGLILPHLRLSWE